jgi:Fe(3+) dicitrate transport protein
MYRISLIITLLCLNMGILLAQASNRASLSGHIVDQNNADVSGAKVTLINSSNRAEINVTTESTGSFIIDNLAPGEYTLSVTGTGFSNTTQTISLTSNENRKITLTLQAGSIAEVASINATRIAGTPEDLKHIPGSVEIVDSKTLENSRIFNTTEALRKVSGLNVRDEEGFGLRPNIGFRGLNPTRATKVLLLEDGIPLAFAPYGDNASYYHPPIDRFEMIEVLKGSGQILYGPSTVGAVINYITPNPPDKPSGSVTLTGGNRDYLNGHINYGGTWKKTGLLFNYMRKQGEGARENNRFGLNDFNFKAIHTLTPKQLLTFKFNYYGEDSNVTYSGLREDEYRLNPRGNRFRNDYFYGDRFGASGTHVYVFNNNVNLTTSLYGSIFQRHWWRQSSNSAQRPNRIFNGSNPDSDCRSMNDLNTTCGNEGRLRKYLVGGAESRLSINHNLFGIRNETQIGMRAHFEDQNRRQMNGDTPTARIGFLSENNERKNQAYSTFIQNRFIFGDLTITPGVRVEHILYERTFKPTNAPVRPQIVSVSGQTELTKVIPGIGISYSPGANTTIFAGVHRGFAPPRTEDIITSSGGSIELDPELSWNYELGVRSIVSRGLRLEATVFRMDYENQIIPASLAGGIGTAFTNAGETRHQGAEFSGRIDTGTIFSSPHNIYIRGAYTYVPTAEFRGVRYSSIRREIITGNRLPYAPEHLLNATLGYSHSSGIDTLVEAVYISRQFSDDLNTIVPTADGQRGLIPSHTIWNATANYNVESIHTTFFFTVKNLFDRTYVADRSRGLIPGPPRLLQAGLKFQF